MTTSNGNGGSGATLRDPELDRTRLRAIHAALTAGDIPTAGKLAEDALNDGIDHAMVLNLVAGRREEEGRLDEALALLRRALAAAPEAIGVMNAIGLCLTRLDRHEEALEAVDEALVRQPGFAPAHANRGSILLALGREAEGGEAFAAAAAIDPANLAAMDGLAVVALRRGDAGEARRLATGVLAREPGWPGAVLTLAGADLAEARPEGAAAALTALLADSRLVEADRPLAIGLRGDALDALGRHDEAFAAWQEANALQVEQWHDVYAGNPKTLALVQDLTAALSGRRVPAEWGHGGRSPAKRHVFLAGFPGSGVKAVAAALAAHPDVVLLNGAEALIDATRGWLADGERAARFCDLEDDALEPWREAYWARIAERGIDPAGKVLVDANAFHSFKLPLIARLFPGARVLLARHDPRDAVLAAFRARLTMSAPTWELLTLEGAAALYAATMKLVEASETAFGLFLHPVQLEALQADPARELKAVADFIDLAPNTALPAPAVAAEWAGRWQDHEAALAPVLSVLAPWLK